MKSKILIVAFFIWSCSTKIEVEGKPGELREQEKATGNSWAKNEPNKGIVSPSKCEGLVSPICVEHQLFTYVKSYPKYDHDTCAILDNPLTPVDPSLCVLDTNLVKKVTPFLPSPIEILGIVSAKPYATTYYRVAYRAGDVMGENVFDESGKEMPLDTSFIKYGWVSDTLRKALAKIPLDSKVRKFTIVVKVPYSENSKEREALGVKNFKAIRDILAASVPSIGPAIDEAIVELRTTVDFEMDIKVLQDGSGWPKHRLLRG